MAKDRVTIRQLVDVGLVKLPMRVRGIDKKNGNEFFGEITTAHGDMVVDGRSSESPSAAAGYVLCISRGYPPGQYPTQSGWPQVSGWKFWHCHDANAVWEPISTLQERYDQR